MKLRTSQIPETGLCTDSSWNLYSVCWTALMLHPSAPRTAEQPQQPGLCSCHCPVSLPAPHAVGSWCLLGPNSCPVASRIDGVSVAISQSCEGGRTELRPASVAWVYMEIRMARRNQPNLCSLFFSSYPHVWKWRYLKQRHFLYMGMNLEQSRHGVAHRHTFLLGAVSTDSKDKSNYSLSVS